jgi:hypothetical protein
MYTPRLTSKKQTHIQGLYTEVTDCHLPPFTWGKGNCTKTAKTAQKMHKRHKKCKNCTKNAQTAQKMHKLHKKCTDGTKNAQTARSHPHK